MNAIISFLNDNYIYIITIIAIVLSLLVYISFNKIEMDRVTDKKVVQTVTVETFVNGYNVAKTTTKKYAPKVKAELENVGSKVTVVAKKSIPFIQQSANKILGLFNKTKKNLKL